MNLLEAIEQRHTVRTYTGEALSGELLQTLEAMIEKINAESGLHLQLINGKENAFDDFSIRYGKWTNVTNYIAMIGPDTANLDELVGYYGEQIVLWAQTQGLRTGWLETTYTDVPEVLDIPDGERMVLSMEIGYSEMSGNPRKLKSVEDMSEVTGTAPDWFYEGMKYAVMAPTAGNQLLFRIVWDGENVSIKSEPGFMEQVDIGIAKYHFELGSGKDHAIWK